MTDNGRPGTVDIANNSNLGKILANTDGRTLYLFAKDSGTKSACTGACAGASAAIAGTTPRSDGPPQVTYNGHPLYTYTGDQKPGDTNGQGLTVFGGGGFALSPAGKQVSGTGSNGGATGY
jgi:predicted lipoprotein with Yx(FWY)xxD motif